MKIEIEKPNLPKFVADWLEFEKKSTTPLHMALVVVRSNIDINMGWLAWSKEVGSSWEKMIATAWLYGYEVEKEPLYYAEVKGLDSLSDRFDEYFSMYTLNAELRLNNYLLDIMDSDTLPHKLSEWHQVGINDTNADFEKVE